jgi:hypothetical protein
MLESIWPLSFVAKVEHVTTTLEPDESYGAEDRTAEFLLVGRSLISGPWQTS